MTSRWISFPLRRLWSYFFPITISCWVKGYNFNVWSQWKGLFIRCSADLQIGSHYSPWGKLTLRAAYNECPKQHKVENILIQLGKRMFISSMDLWLLIGGEAPIPRGRTSLHIFDRKIVRGAGGGGAVKYPPLYVISNYICFEIFHPKIRYTILPLRNSQFLSGCSLLLCPNRVMPY